MIISYKHGYCYLANEKSGSESVHFAAGEEASIGFSRIGAQKHDDLKSFRCFMKDSVGEIPGLGLLANFFFIREPAAWYVSWFNSRSRKGLSDPLHRRHHRYTGNLSFDAFIESALSSEPLPCTKVKRQTRLTKKADGQIVMPVALEDAEHFCSSVLPCSMIGRTFNDPKFRLNSSVKRRVSVKEIPESMRRVINEQLFPDDYQAYLSAKSRNWAEFENIVRSGRSELVEKDLEVRQKLLSDTNWRTIAFETAYSQAQSRLYKGHTKSAVVDMLDQFKTIDRQEVYELAEKRVRRVR